MLETERFSPRSVGIDGWDDQDALTAMWEAQMAAVAALGPARPALAAAAAALADRLRHPNARLVYGGAGASGQIALQDALEMTPTFGWPQDRLVVLLAGGPAARLQPAGASEDETASARDDLRARAIGPADALIAVAASGTTPYTVALVGEARHRGALTIALANNADTALLEAADHGVLLATGPEVIAGSTRLKAGTAQKAALGMLSSLTMMRLGHVVDGLMVSLVADNAKLRDRARHIVATLAETDLPTTAAALAATDGVVKLAVLVAAGDSPAAARDRLNAVGGDLRAARRHQQGETGGHRAAIRPPDRRRNDPGDEG